MNNTLALVRDDGPTLPALIDRAGERAVWRYLEFFTVNIRNVNTRAAYGLAAGRFLRWCEGRGITRIEDVQPMHVAAYIEGLGKVRKARRSSSTWPASACFLTGSSPVRSLPAIRRIRCAGLAIR